MAKRLRKKEEDREDYRHENEICKNVVPVRLASYDTSKPKPKKCMNMVPILTLSLYGLEKQKTYHLKFPRYHSISLKKRGRVQKIFKGR